MAAGRVRAGRNGVIELLRDLLRFCSSDWRENAVARELFRHVPALLVAVATFGALSMFAEREVDRALVFSIPASGTGMTLRLLAPSAAKLLLLGFLPALVYARIACRRLWSGSEEFRALPIPPHERIVPILGIASLAATCLCIAEPGVGIVGIVMHVVTATKIHGDQVLAASCRRAAELATIAPIAFLIATTVVARSLVTRFACGAADGRPLWSLVPLYFACLAPMLPPALDHHSWLQEALGIYYWPAGGSAFSSSMQFVLLRVAMVAASLVVALPFIRADIALARRILFQ